MSEKMVVSVDASAGHPDLLTVQDVFTHVLELFQLVNESDPENQGQIVWRLLSATMNSPFTVTAEAVAAKPGVSVDDVARKQKRAFASNYRELRSGRIPSAWANKKCRETVSSLLARNRDGIGSTKIDPGITSEIGPIVITPDDAVAASISVANNAMPPRKIKDQVGSIEGKLLEIASHYGHPAIQIRERKTGGEIWCLVPEALVHEFSLNTSAEDVWTGTRVVVRGTISYSADGKISRVVASSIRRVDSKEISEELLVDKSFTGGLSTTEYLDRLMDGTLG